MLLRSAEMDPSVMGPRDAIRFTAVRHVSASYHTGAIRSRWFDGTCPIASARARHRPSRTL